VTSSIMCNNNLLNNYTKYLQTSQFLITSADNINTKKKPQN